MRQTHIRSTAKNRNIQYFRDERILPVIGKGLLILSIIGFVVWGFFDFSPVDSVMKDLQRQFPRATPLLLFVFSAIACARQWKAYKRTRETYHLYWATVLFIASSVFMWVAVAHS